MQHTRTASIQWCCMTMRVQTVTRSLNTEHLNLTVVDKRVEQAHSRLTRHLRTQ